MNNSKSLLCRTRKTVGLLMFLLAPICLIISSWGTHFNRWNASVSGLYWTNARPVFISLISIVIFLLFSYKGYNWKDRVTNIICGICLTIIILFPSFNEAILASDPITKYDLFPSFNKRISRLMHNFSSVIMTITCFINIFFLFTKHGEKITSEKLLRNKIYRILSIILMVPFIFQTFCVFGPMFGVYNVELPAFIFYLAEAIEFASAGTAYMIVSVNSHVFSKNRKMS